MPRWGKGGKGLTPCPTTESPTEACLSGVENIRIRRRRLPDFSRSEDTFKEWLRGISQHSMVIPNGYTTDLSCIAMRKCEKQAECSRNIQMSYLENPELFET